MLFLGDCHGSVGTYKWVLNSMLHSGGRKFKNSSSLQLGDFGIFSTADLKEVEWLATKPKARIIPGNHDNPSEILKLSNCLGYYGYDQTTGIFWLGGGFSIDFKDRIPGETWWAEEQLTDAEMQRAIALYEEVKPKIVASHECPTAMKAAVLPHYPEKWMTSRTETTLETMFSKHQPDYWVFGHYHVRVERKILNTQFIGLNEMRYGPLTQCIFEIPGLEWG